MSAERRPRRLRRRLLLAIPEALLLLVVGTAVGLSANAVRGRNSINLHRDYSGAAPDAGHGHATRPTTATSSAPLEHPFQVVDLAEAGRLLAERDSGFPYVFVDARNDEQYESGHIPGAVQCDFYRIADYSEHVLAALLGAEKVVVYCSGGDCEDSLLVCRHLRDSGAVAAENLYVYEGGWAEWQAQGLPTVTGKEP
jgi:rhodanese-related sulfurtransferase